MEGVKVTLKIITFCAPLFISSFEKASFVASILRFPKGFDIDVLDISISIDMGIWGFYFSGSATFWATFFKSLAIFKKI